MFPCNTQRSTSFVQTGDSCFSFKVVWKDLTSRRNCRQLFIRSQTASAHLGACPHSGYRGAWRTTGSLSPGTDHMWKTKGNRLTESFIFGSCCYFICCWKQHKMFRLTSGHEHRRNLIVTNPAIYGALFCRRPWSEEGWMNSYSDIAFC